MSEYIFEKRFRIPNKFPPDIEKLSQILEETEEETLQFIFEDLKAKLMAPPIEAEVFLEDSGNIRVVLVLNLIVSPLSPLVSAVDQIAIKISNFFFNTFQRKLKGFYNEQKFK